MADLNSEQNKKKYGELIAKAWMDEGFKKKLIQNPEQTMKEFGIEMPKDVHFKVVENTKNNVYLVLPTKPNGKLSEVDLTELRGGMTFTNGTCSGPGQPCYGNCNGT